jgi:hypothetical protein
MNWGASQPMPQQPVYPQQWQQPQMPVQQPPMPQFQQPMPGQMSQMQQPMMPQQQPMMPQPQPMGFPGQQPMRGPMPSQMPQMPGQMQGMAPPGMIAPAQMQKKVIEPSKKKKRLLYFLLGLLAVTGIAALWTFIYFITHYK